jgi:Ribbon-helix-helix protein, copG family
MRKTSVYLSEDDAQRLSRLAAVSGRPQSELIRDGIRHVIGAPSTRRRFRSLGRGHGGGKPYRSWKSRELLRKVMGP